MATYIYKGIIPTIQYSGKGKTIETTKQSAVVKG